MHPGKRLQQDHPKSQSLQRIQNPEPQPETARDECPGLITSSPREVQTSTRDTPPDLGPARGSKAAGEDGEDPAVGFGESA